MVAITFLQRCLGQKYILFFPAQFQSRPGKKYADDTLAYLKKLTRNEIDFEVIILPTYQNYLQATVSLKNDHENGMVVFVFDDTNPATYSLIDFELKGWSLKRATAQELLRKYKPMSKTNQSLQGAPFYEKAKREWESYIEMGALGIIQKLNCVPLLFSRIYLIMICK